MYIAQFPALSLLYPGLVLYLIRLSVRCVDHSDLSDVVSSGRYKLYISAQVKESIPIVTVAVGELILIFMMFCGC